MSETHLLRVLREYVELERAMVAAEKAVNNQPVRARNRSDHSCQQEFALKFRIN